MITIDEMRLHIEKMRQKARLPHHTMGETVELMALCDITDILAAALELAVLPEVNYIIDEDDPSAAIADPDEISARCNHYIAEAWREVGS